MSGVGREIVLVDLNRARAETEANDEQVRRSAYPIIAGKGSTDYGIGSAGILRDGIESL